MMLHLVPTFLGKVKCRYKLVHQYGRGSNRRAVYVCQTHPATNFDCYGNVGFRGWTNRKAK